VGHGPLRCPDHRRDRAAPGEHRRDGHGEGKTLVATMPLYLNALEGKAPTSSRSTTTWLSATPSGWGHLPLPGPVRAFIKNDMTPPQRREAYAADITYGTNNEFGFDYLRDNMAVRGEDLVQRVFHFAIGRRGGLGAGGRGAHASDHQRTGGGEHPPLRRAEAVRRWAGPQTDPPAERLSGRRREGAGSRVRERSTTRRR